MALAGEDNNVVRLCVTHCVFNRISTVAYCSKIRFHVFHTLENIFQNCLRVLGARIVARDNAKVRQISCYFAHFRTFCTVPVAAAAEHGDNSALCKAFHCFNDIFQAVGCVRIVNHNRIIGRNVHNLRSALYAFCKNERFCDVRNSYARTLADADGAKRVVNRKSARNVKTYIFVSERCINFKKHTALIVFYIFCANIAFFVNAVFHNFAVCVSDYGFHIIVICINHRALAHREQYRFRFCVFVHCFVKIEMVLRKICKRADIKRYAVHSVEAERVRRYLHNAIFRPLRHHIGKKLLKFE